MKYLLLNFLTTIICLTAFGQAGDSVYLFSYFRGNGEDGLHLAWSEDGYQWQSLNNDNSFLKPEVGEAKLMRDPCIIQGPDGRFHMVWTAGWTEKGIGYAHSEDLLKWSEQQYIPVMAHESSARNTWAPEINYDAENARYMIYWATTIPGRFPDTETTGDDGYNHRTYYVTTKNFKDFSETKLLYDPGFNSIDATIKKAGNQFIMFFKDETRHPPAKDLHLARSNNLTGPYEYVRGPITTNWVEGPTAVRKEGKWIVYFDQYTRHKMGAVVSADLVNWTDISDQLSFPGGVRHGTVLLVSRKIVENIKKATE